jgi:hypothetical protein
MADSQVLLRQMMTHLVAKARGPAVPLATAAIQQIPEFLNQGMPVPMAIRETLHTAIFAAQVKAKHCVGPERHAYDDFITLCREMGARTDFFQS